MKFCKHIHIRQILTYTFKLYSCTFFSVSFYIVFIFWLFKKKRHFFFNHTNITIILLTSLLINEYNLLFYLSKLMQTLFFFKLSLFKPEVVTLDIYFVVRWHPFTWSHFSFVHCGAHFPPHFGPKVPDGQIWLQNLPKYPAGQTVHKLNKIEKSKQRQTNP